METELNSTHSWTLCWNTLLKWWEWHVFNTHRYSADPECIHCGVCEQIPECRSHLCSDESLGVLTLTAAHVLYGFGSHVVHHQLLLRNMNPIEFINIPLWLKTICTQFAGVCQHSMYYQASDVPQMTEKCHILYITPTIKVKRNLLTKQNRSL